MASEIDDLIQCSKVKGRRNRKKCYNGLKTTNKDVRISRSEVRSKRAEEKTNRADSKYEAHTAAYSNGLQPLDEKAAWANSTSSIFASASNAVSNIFGKGNTSKDNKGADGENFFMIAIAVVLFLFLFLKNMFSK